MSREALSSGLSRRRLLRLGATAVAVAGVGGSVVPVAVGAERLPNLAGVANGSSFMAWKGVDGDQRIWWNRFDPGGSVWSDPQPIFGASTGFRPALATVGA